MRMDQVVGLLRVGAVGLCAVLEPTPMVVGVVAHLMSFGHNLLEQVWVFVHVVAYHEEGGLYPMLPKRVENKGRGFRNRTVVKGEINHLFVLVHSPRCPGVKPAQPFGRLLNDHIAEA